MAGTRRTPSIALQTVEQGVEEGFSPFHVQKVDYKLKESTTMSVELIVDEPWDDESNYPKWEKIDYVLRLADFIETLGFKAKISQWIRPPR